MDKQNKGELERKAALAKKQEATARKMRAKILAAKEHEEQVVEKNLKKWKTTKAQTFEKDLVARKRAGEQEAAEKRAALREAQQAWREQEKARIIAEATKAQKAAQASAAFREGVREKMMRDEMERVQSKLQADKIEMSRQQSATLHAEALAKAEAARASAAQEAQQSGWKLW